LEIFTTRQQIRQYLSGLGNKTIGFIPTMGALHNGHLSLIQQAKRANDVAVCSIFVNPTQFNDPKDLENYPRPIEADIAKLESINCDVLFNPTVSEMYDDNEQWHLNIGQLEFLLEGEFRPGHYQGVMQVVYKLLDIVKPTALYMGQKDYQQVMVISRMIALKNLPVKMEMCMIERETDGLAMSSRNIHLTAEDRKHALALSHTLQWAKDNFESDKIAEIEEKANEMLHSAPGVNPEYFELADGKTLLPADGNSESIVALTAARVGKTRLIDNMLIR
jgi:pantoate--beta-alanine ligase